VVMCLERGANDLHMLQLKHCLSVIQIDLTFLVPVYPSCPGKRGH